MRILVSILTSSKPYLAKLCYDSIHSQINNDDVSIVVIVNSTNLEHVNDIRKIMPVGTNIQETESNGKPGKGHNSVLHYFRSQTQYDYCVLVDGDDFLYPRALSRLQHYLQCEPDVLFVAFNDNLNTVSPSNDCNVPHITFRNKCVLYYNVDEFTLGEWYKIKGAINPFQNDICNMNSYARPFAFSRKTVDYNHDIYYDEYMALYDDFIVYLKAFELDKLGKLKAYTLVDTNLYLYNLTFQDTASTNFFADGNEHVRKQENVNYQDSIKNKFLTLKRWDLKQFPLLELGQTSEPDNLLVKCKFVDELAKRLELPRVILQKDNIDIVLNHCKNTNNAKLYDDLIQTLEWICSKY
jgi:hypothetical protein